MKRMKLYEAEDKMISLIRDNYNVLQALGAFGISLGFGDKTVQQVCDEQHVDTFTFLAVVNFIINGINPSNHVQLLSVSTLMQYLKASHEYYLDFQLPSIRRKLEDALSLPHNLTTPQPQNLTTSQLILRLYDEYSRAIVHHMRTEERQLFPYVERLLRGEGGEGCDVHTYGKHHTNTTEQLRELKHVIIKYLPGDPLSNNKLTAALYDIYNNEEWLRIHAQVEENMFMPAIAYLEKKQKEAGITANISNMIAPRGEQSEALSEREKEVIVALVQGMSNKEIAEHLFISVNTVLTHRRNIARKLQIHSPAGLTIYAIVNKLIDVADLKV